MKKIIFLLAVTFCASSFPSKAQMLFPLEKKKKTEKVNAVLEEMQNDPDIKGNDEKTAVVTDIIQKIEEPESRVQIEGLGNFSVSQNGGEIDPSANIYARIIPLKKNTQFKVFLGFNLGSRLDSSGVDSIKLSSLFLPEKGKSGYIARMEYNLFPFFRKLFTHTADDSEQDGYAFNTQLNPFVEYNYHRINIKDVVSDSSSIQTSTWMLGLNFSHSITKNSNLIGLQVTPFFKSTTVTDGTLGIYRNIFKESLKGEDGPQTVKFIGLNIGLQINRFLFSFVFEDLKTAALKNTPLSGGVYTIKASVTGDFLKL